MLNSSHGFHQKVHSLNRAADLVIEVHYETIETG